MSKNNRITYKYRSGGKNQQKPDKDIDKAPSKSKGGESK